MTDMTFKNGQFTTPVGRIVGGDPYREAPVTDPRTKAAKLDKAGNPQTQQYIALALKKSDLEVQAWKAEADAAARAAWPQWHNGPNGACTNPSFSSKIIDGDGKNSKGVSYASREGHAGHWVVKFTRSGAVGPVQVCAHDGKGWKDTGPGLLGADGKPTRVVKCGDYVKIQGETKSNAPAQTDGMYMNMGMIAFWEEGQAIILGPSADEAFGSAPPPGTAAVDQSLSAPGAAAPADMGYSGYAEPDDTPPPPGAHIPEPVMTPKANGKTREHFHSKGWTDAQLVEHGYMIA